MPRWPVGEDSGKILVIRVQTLVCRVQDNRGIKPLLQFGDTPNPVFGDRNVPPSLEAPQVPTELCTLTAELLKYRQSLLPLSFDHYRAFGQRGLESVLNFFRPGVDFRGRFQGGSGHIDKLNFGLAQFGGANRDIVESAR